MRAIPVEVIPELEQLVFEIYARPEQCAVQTLASNGAASYLGISRSAIRQLVGSGQLSRVQLPSLTQPYSRLDRFLLDKSDLDALIERGKERQSNLNALRGL